MKERKKGGRKEGKKETNIPELSLSYSLREEI
jgi:hypothetical protein